MGKATTSHEIAVRAGMGDAGFAHLAMRISYQPAFDLAECTSSVMASR